MSVQFSLRELRERESYVLSEGGLTPATQIIVGEFVMITVAERLALVEAVEAARRIVAIEDLYRDLPSDVRAGSLLAFEPKHRRVMNEARAALARFIRYAIAGAIAGATFGFGLASFGWWNPYLSLSLTLGALVLFATVVVAARTEPDA